MNEVKITKKESPQLKIIEVIHISFPRGKGLEKDPVRTIEQYWSLKGELIAEYDPIFE